jgi:phosphomannomutase / phosphoglucomutase
MKLKKSATDSQAAALPGTLVPLLLSLAALAVAAALIWLTLIAPSNERYRQDLAQTTAQLQVGALNQALQTLERDLTALASNPQLQVALQQGNAASLQRLLRYSYAGNMAVYLHRSGDAAVIDNAEAPLTFAALDMIRRAERNMPVAPEAYRLGTAWRFYAVRALRASSNAPIGGTLTAVMDLDRLASSLPPLDDNAGQLTLIQRFPDAPEQILLQRGTGYGEPIRLATANPAWFLEFRPGSGLSEELLNPLLLLAAILIALFGLLAGLLMLQRQWRSCLQADAETLQSLARGHRAAGVMLGPLEAVAASIMQLAQMAGRNPGTTPSKESGETRPVRPAAVREPEMVLDIDILDQEPFDLGDSLPEQAIEVPPAEIFRAYDIRGIVGESLTADALYWLGRAIGSTSIDAGQTGISVGRDGRLSGPDLSEQLIRGLIDSGCQVTDLGMVPTPVLYFATHVLEASSGVMLTGSHNPSQYNGLKVVIAGQTLSEGGIRALRTRLVEQNLHSGAGSRDQQDLLPAYRQRILEDVALARPLKVVIDCGNGVAGVIAESLFEELGCEVIPLHCTVDGNFPNHHPDPGKPENLADLIAAVLAHEADLGIAFDGDADRLGVVTNTGEIIYPDRLLMLLAEDVVTRHPGADVVFDVKCTRRLPALISRLGGRPVMCRSGHSLVKAKMVEIGALLGGEMSGHVFFKERWYGFDDGLYSACRLLEILSSQPGLTSAELMSRYTTGLTTPEINLVVGEQRKFEIMAALGKKTDWDGGKLTMLDGIRVDYPFGWGLVRPSNTTPTLTLRFEADKPEDLNRVQQLFRDQLAAAAPDLNLTF